MPSFKLRSSTTSATANWPAEPPVFKRIPPPQMASVPLSLRPADHNILSVAPGTSVSAGQTLTDVIPETSHAALAPFDGIVGATRSITLANNQIVRAVDVQRSQEPAAPADEVLELPEFTGRMAKLASEAGPITSWIDRIRKAGIFANRPTCPDLLGQLYQLLNRPVDTVICNLLDMDTSLRLSAALGANHPQQIAAGMHLLCSLAHARNRLVVADDASPPRWIKPLRRLTRRLDIAMVPLHNDYPQPEPTLLLYRLLKRRLRPRRLPTEQGVLIVDAASAWAIGRNVLAGSPMLDIPLAVHDQLRWQSHFLWTAVGTPLSHVLGQINWIAQGLAARSGALFRNMRIGSDTILAGTELTIHLDSLRPAGSPQPCVRCGWCAEGCPTRVQPAGILEAAQRQDIELAEHYGIEACIECGICSYVCPSLLPLMESIRRLRTKGDAGVASRNAPLP